MSYFKSRSSIALFTEQYSVFSFEFDNLFIFYVFCLYVNRIFKNGNINKALLLNRKDGKPLSHVLHVAGHRFLTKSSLQSYWLMNKHNSSVF